MKFGGLQKNSLIDYPGKIACVLFVCGCNFDCPYCHNPELVKESIESPLVFHENKAYDFLKKRKGLIDAVVISGGEPNAWPHLTEMLELHSDAIFQLYTNGTLIDDKRTDEFARLGNVLPCISVEGFEKETDERRGKGTFRKISDAMDRLKEGGVLFGFSATATRENNEFIVSDEFLDYYNDKGISIEAYDRKCDIGNAHDFASIR